VFIIFARALIQINSGKLKTYLIKKSHSRKVSQAWQNVVLK